MKTFPLILLAASLAACTTTGTHTGTLDNQPVPANAKLVHKPAYLGAKTFAYTCANGTTFTAQFKREEAHIILSDGTEVTLPQAVSASGIHYQSKEYSLWAKGAGATWTVGLKPSTTCTTQL